MNKLFTFLMLIALTVSGFAQAPQKMSYQCVIRNSSGALVTNQAVGMKISILQGSATGNVVFSETYNPNPQTNANGLVSIEIGGGLVITGTFSNIPWASGLYFLKTETDPTGGTNYTIVGTSQLLSVPYALYAKTAGNGFSGNYNDLTNKPILFDGTWTNINGKPTTLIGYGITDGMSTSHVASGITSTMITNWNTAFGWGNHTGLYRPISYVPVWTEIMSKPTTLSGYGITDAVNTSGDQTISGNKTFAGKTQVITPVNAADATNKAYVDGLKQQVEKLLDFVEAIYPIPTDGLVAYYPFNGNANDMSGNNLNGTVNGATLTVDRNGSPNKAYSFNKTKITVSDNNLLDFTNSFSLCAWFKSNNKPDSLVQGIIGKSRPDGGAGYGLSLAHPGNLFGVQPNFPAVGMGINNGSTGGNVSYHSDSLILGWHFVVGTYDGSQLKLYVDGKLKDTESTSVTLQNSGRPLYIGRECGSVDGPTPPGDTVRYFYGKIDDVRLYNRPLNATEVQSLYNDGNILQLDYVPYVNDIDGNSYNTVKIGNQVWMAENLKTTKFNDGTSIPHVTDGPTWGGLSTPAYCWYNNDAPTYKNLYGALYNWYAVNTGKLCPSGWHVSTDSDWKTLEMYLGMTQEQADAGGWRGTDQGTKLKSVTGWNPGGAATGTDIIGFSGLPGGEIGVAFGGAGDIAVWWVTPEYNSTDGWFRYLNNYNNTESNGVARNYQPKSVGESVRCVKD